MAKITRYGKNFEDYDDLQIELWMIGHAALSNDQMFEHMMKARSLMWPKRYRHDWTDLLYREFIQNDITVMMGAASTQKTSHAAEYVLIRYLSNPFKTLVILSTIDLDKLDSGVFGEVKMLWSEAKKIWGDSIPGNLIEYKRAIVTDNLEDGDVRDMRRGIIGKACYVGGKWVGLGKLAGTKQENVIFLCDECQFMSETFIASWPNLFSNGNVKIIASGNPKHDPDDQLGIAAEPKDGWNTLAEPSATTTWDTRFMGARCVNLVGIDSPNFRAVASGKPEPYPKLIGPKFAQRIAHDWGSDSPEYYTQVKGVMRIDMAVQRVITRQLCREHSAQEKAIWSGAQLTLVHGLDPSYGGGDMCWEVVLQFGNGGDGLMLIEFLVSRQIKIDLKRGISAEDQVAIACRNTMDEFKIPLENSGYDATGKGTMGFAFSKLPGRSPEAIDSGGRPTDRSVRQDLFVPDDKEGRRLKKCSEHYSKFITEMWFSWHYTIQANQCRGLPDDVMLEGCGRKYETVAGNKIEVEPKDDLKKRIGKSPNKFDAAAIALEMARRRGFVIAKLGPNISVDNKEDFFETEAREWRETVSKRLLVHK